MITNRADVLVRPTNPLNRQISLDGDDPSENRSRSLPMAKKLRPSKIQSEQTSAPLPPGMRLVQVLRGHTDIVHQATWMPDGERMVSVSRDGRLMLWNVMSGEPTLLHVDDTPLYAVVVAPDGRLVYGGASGKLNMLEIVHKTRALSKSLSHKWCHAAVR
jgi:WD40 repeat protein